MKRLDFDLDSTEWADKPKREAKKVEERHSNPEALKKIENAGNDNRKLVQFIQIAVTIIFVLALLASIVLLFVWGFKVAFAS
jgi:fatty acid desaturase